MFQQFLFRSETILAVKIQDGRHFFHRITENGLQGVQSRALTS